LPAKKTGRKKSAKKALKQSIKRNLRNKSVKTEVKTWIKKVEGATQAEQAQQFLARAFSVVDKAAKRRVIHDNQAGRIKARLSRIVAGLQTAKSA
jgi:small subunit ribosomal protein S20